MCQVESLSFREPGQGACLMEVGMGSKTCAPGESAEGDETQGEGWLGSSERYVGVGGL